MRNGSSDPVATGAAGGAVATRSDHQMSRSGDHGRGGAGIFGDHHLLDPTRPIRSPGLPRPSSPPFGRDVGNRWRRRWPLVWGRSASRPQPPRHIPRRWGRLSLRVGLIPRNATTACHDIGRKRATASPRPTPSEASPPAKADTWSRSSPKVSSSIVPSSRCERTASRVGSESAHRSTQARLRLNIDPVNQVVHGSPREVSLTALHGRSKGSSRKSTTSDQNQSGSATDRRRNSSKSSIAVDGHEVLVWSCSGPLWTGAPHDLVVLGHGRSSTGGG